MDNYPSKRRRISPFTSILITPSDAPKEPVNGHEDHAPKLTNVSSTQAKLTCLDPNEVHPSASFTDSPQKQQNRSASLSRSKPFQESTNGTYCENEASGQHELRYNADAERPTASVESLHSSVVVTSGKNGIIPENGILQLFPPEAISHAPFPEKHQKAMAEEPRASPPASDSEKAPSAPQLDRIILKPVEQDQSAHMVNGASTVDLHVPEQEPLDGPEPELPFTPTKQSLDVLEPRLPSTPSQLGLEAPPTPPKGLASATSPRRLRRKRHIAHHSSPLKNGNLNSTDTTHQVPYVSSLGPRMPVVNLRRSAQMFTLNAEQVRLQMEKLGTEPSKNTGSVADVALYNTEIFQQTPSLAERLALFLPFARPITSTQSSAAPCINPPSDKSLDIEVSQPPEIQKAKTLDLHLDSASSMMVVDGPDSPLARPHSMTIAESLDLHLGVTISTPVVDGPGSSLTQPNSMAVAQSLEPSHLPDTSTQGLDIVFTSHQQLLVVKIQLTRDESAGNSVKIKTKSISPWAESELGPWLRNEAQSLPRTTIERAIRSYWETSLIRASCWRRCEEDVGAPAQTEPILCSSINKPEFGPLQKPPPEKNPTMPPPTIAEPPEPPALGPPLRSSTPNPSHPLQPHLGRRFLLFTNPPVSLLVAWHITIAADGTVQNNISVHPAYPTRWTDESEHRHGQGQGQGEGKGEGEGEEQPPLARIGEAFDALLAHRGVFESIRELCRRIFAQ